jgi:hypothetical protein
MQSSLYDENITRNNKPIYDKKHLFSKFLVMSEVWHYIMGGDNESNNIFKLQKKVLRIISGVSNHTSCRQIFKDCNISTLSSLYILEVICFIKKYKYFMAKNLDIHNHNMQRKLNLHVQCCSTVLFKKA